MPKGDLFNELPTPKGRPFLERGCKGSAFYCNRKLFLDFFTTFFALGQLQSPAGYTTKLINKHLRNVSANGKINGDTEVAFSRPHTSTGPRLTTHDYALHAPTTTP